MDRYKLIQDIPLLHKGSIFDFDVETSLVYSVGLDNPGEVSEYPLRPGLANYLWLLRTERGFFKKVK